VLTIAAVSYSRDRSQEVQAMFARIMCWIRKCLCRRRKWRRQKKPAPNVLPVGLVSVD